MLFKVGNMILIAAGFVAWIGCIFAVAVPVEWAFRACGWSADEAAWQFRRLCALAGTLGWWILCWCAQGRFRTDVELVREATLAVVGPSAMFALIVVSGSAYSSLTSRPDTTEADDYADRID